VKTLPEVQIDALSTAVNLVIPEAALAGAACLLLVLAMLGINRVTALLVGFVALIAAGGLAIWLGPQEIASFWALAADTPYSPRTVAPFDPTAAASYIRWLAIGSGMILLLISYAEIRDEVASEMVACILVVVAGASLVGRANDLVSLFLALEMISIPTYILLYLPSRTKQSQEAGVKYFLLSILSSAILLFGMSYLYGLTGSTNIGSIIETLTLAHKSNVSPMALVAMMMIIAGLGFRITAVPFHFYAPDVYQGGPTGVIAQLAFVPKLVGFLGLARLLGLLIPPLTDLPFDSNTLIPLTLWVIAVISMSLGNVLALLQDNLKRMMAYSGVAHTGYMLIGLVVACAAPQGGSNAATGLDAVLVYLVAYALMSFGFFALILHLNGHNENSVEMVDDLAGLGETHPYTAAALTVLLISLIGLPATAGFAGKFLLFMEAFQSPTTTPMGNLFRVLAIIAAVNAAIAAVYYLRIIGVMYLRTPLKPAEAPRSMTPALLAGVFCALATIALGVYPKPMTDAARASVPLQDDQPKSSVSK
jgi:NADH-quinone oxidoreductase subunit N